MATARAEHYVHSEENAIDFAELTPPEMCWTGDNVTNI